MRTDVKPFLRWAGSKRQILHELEVFGVEARRYVEPFVGSACLFFRRAPEDALLGDLNGELISTYRTVRRSAGSVHKAYTAWENSEAEYKRIRAIALGDLTAIEAAARFIYLNRFCFNGLYRTNTAGLFNVPYGGQRSGYLPSLANLKACAKLLRRAELHHGTFTETLAKVRTGDFVYMDPPFSVAAKRVFKQYNATVFSEVDLRVLRNWLEYFAGVGIPFLVSYAESDEADYLAQHFRVKRLSVRRHIAGNFSNRISSSEVLIHV